MPFLPGVKKLRLSTLILPGDFGRRLPTENTARLLESIERVGIINLPVVDLKRRLIAGHDRVFALKERGDQWVHARMFDGSEQELSIVQWAENHHRRAHNADDHVWRQLNGAVTAMLPAEEPPPTVTAKPRKGRPVSPRGAARREVAAAAGLPLERVAKADRKAEEATAERSSMLTAEEVPALPPDVQTFGFTPEAEVVADALDALWEHEKARAARTSMEKAHRALAKLAKAPPPVFLDHDGLDSLKPVQLCRWCEGSPHRATCDVCQGRGWLSALDDLTPPPKRSNGDADLPF